jgi:hypothetical protein
MDAYKPRIPGPVRAPGSAAMESEIHDLESAMKLLERIREHAGEALEVHRLGDNALNLLIAQDTGETR